MANLTGDNLFITGNAGIGTNAPQQQLSVQGALNLDQANSNNGSHLPGLTFGSFSGEGIASKRTGGGNQFGLDLYTGSTPRLSITSTGNVGIGTTSPASKLEVAGDVRVVGRVNGRDVPADGVKLDTHVGNTSNPHSTTAAQVGALPAAGGTVSGNLRVSGSLSVDGATTLTGNVGIGTTSPQGKLDVRGDIRAGNSDLYFTEPNHNHTGVGNAAGWAAIENARDHDALMILGRSGTSRGRYVRLWDYLQVNGGLEVTANLAIGTGSPAARLHITSGEPHVRLDSVGDRAVVQIGKGGALQWDFGVGTGPGNNDFWFGDFSNYQMVLRKGGGVDIPGRIGTNGFSNVPKTRGWGGGIHTWDVEAEGTMWSRSGYQTGARDLAENYLASADFEPGDVVCLDQLEDRIVASERPNDLLVLGVVSTAPGVVLGSERDVEEQKMYPVALCGRVPCKVTDESGPVSRGDLLTTSSIPGHAMRALPVVVDGQEVYRPGTIIGKALEPLPSGAGLVDVWISRS